MERAFRFRMYFLLKAPCCNSFFLGGTRNLKVNIQFYVVNPIAIRSLNSGIPFRPNHDYVLLIAYSTASKADCICGCLIDPS